METVTQVDRELPAIYGRSKGLPWFDMIYKRDIIVIGAGGIGSHLVRSLSRTGARLYVYDHDKFEDHNGGQFMFKEDVGLEKTHALKRSIASYSKDCEMEVFGKYVRSSETGKIVLCGPDDIEVRKMAFEKWVAYVDRLSDDERRECFFQDGRLLAEQFRIFNIPGDDQVKKDWYYDGFLAGKRRPHKPKCTASQTEYAASGIGSKMVGYIANWLTNVKYGDQTRAVPRSCEYFQVRDQYIIIE